MTADGSSIAIVLVLCCVLQAVYACLWLGAAGMRLSQRSSLRWGLGTLLGAVAMALVLARPWLDPAFGRIAPNLLNVAGALVLLQGVRIFLRRRAGRGELLAVLGLAVAGIAAPALLIDPAHALVSFTTSSLMAWCMARAGWLVWRCFDTDLGLLPSRLLSLPFGLGGAVLLARSGLSAMPGAAEGAGMGVSTSANLTFAILFVVVSLLINVALWSMLVVRLVIRLRHLSMHDTLTRLLNRRGFEEALRTERQRQRREGTPHAVLLVDIDHFKRINDTHGHPAGDAALVSVAARLSAELRAIDRIGRVGGEEFAILLPGTPPESAVCVAERLRQAVSGQPHELPGATVAITVSIGVAEVRRIERDASPAWRRADAALYEAKSAGRDRVVQAA